MDRQLLARATENSDAPTPGYMYLDIAKNAASNPATCGEIAKYLANRLASKQNHNVKYKCLKVISKTCVSPYVKGNFKRALSQDPNAMMAIKEAIQFRGPPDPVRGDEPYERVRAAAKEALDAVYSDTPPDQGTSGAPFATSISSSYGPTPHHQGGGGGGAPGGQRRMEGIGNPMFSDPRLAPQPQGLANMTIKDVVNEAKDTVIGMIKDPLARNATIQINSQIGTMPRPGGSGGYGGPSGYSGPPPGRNELMHQTGGQWTMASNRGPGAINPPPNYANDSAYYKSRESGNAYSWAQKGAGAPGGVGGSWASATPSVASQARQPYEHQATPSITVTSNGAPATIGGGGTAVSDGSYEKQLIMELCPPGGMKAEPPPDKLNQFARSVANLNPDLVCPVLLDCLEAGQPWIIRAKALWVIEACIKHGQKPGAASNAYTDFFHACSAEVAPLATHNRAQIREPAARVLALMGIAVPVGGAAPPAPPTVAPPAAAPPAAAPPAVPPPPPVMNLLDFDNDDSTPAPAPSTQAAPIAAGGDNLFGGLNVSAPPTAPPPSAAAPPPPSNDNLLGDFLSDSSSPALAAEVSLFGDMNVKDSTAAPPPNAQVSQAADLFGDMSLKTETNAPTPAPPAPAPSGGSAFAFISQSASTDNAAGDKKPAAAPVPPAQSRDSFDPLKNMTPTTAKKMMQVSPEQMQAAMYHQMLMQPQMQQQMQIAQMMAMQQQQARRGSAMLMPTPMPGVMQLTGGANRASMAFQNKPVKNDDKRFDFVQDAMKMEKKK